MKKIMLAAVMATFAFATLPGAADADVIIKVKPRVPVVKKVIIVQPKCYYKTVKTYKGNKVIIVKRKICK